ncbi:MAG: putative exocyst complex component 4-like, partial [Trebouxia sp. A1-2]
MNSPAFSLQRDSTNQAVNWDAVDDELDKIPSELKDPRFDSLRHVLNILSAVDAEAALEELRGQRDTIEELVDEVVSGYHNGFNKAIHNYSQILQLFADCKTHVNTLRSSLQEAKGQLGAQSRSLQQQWRRSISLGDIVRLLSDARSVVDVPWRLEQLERTKASWQFPISQMLEQYNRLGNATHIYWCTYLPCVLQDWTSAVNLLIDSCSKLARHELSRV